MTGTAEKPRGGRILRALDAVPTLVWILVGALVLLGVAGLFGGLNTAQRHVEELPSIPVGEEHVGPQFSVAVHDATLMDVAPGFSIEADEGNEYLVVTVTLTNNYTKSTILIKEAIALEWLDTEHATVERTVVVSDRTTLVQAHPGVPVDVAMVWQVPRDSIDEGDELRVSIMEASLRTDSELVADEYWHDPVPVAYVDVVAKRDLSGSSE